MIDPQAAAAARERKSLVLSLLGLAAFLALCAFLIRAHVRTETRPPWWDQAIHLHIALDYREALAAGRWWTDGFFLPPKAGMPPFPPAYHLLIAHAYDAADPARDALWVNWFYLAVLAGSLFGIAWRLRPDSTALAVAVIFCGAPAVQELTMTQLVDLPLIASAAAAYWALLASERFTRWGPSLAFGLLHAVGMLHKWSFFSYMLPAYLVALRSLGWYQSRWQALSGLLLGIGLPAPWYAAHAVLLPSRLVQASSDFAVPFWKDGAWAQYLRASPEALGPVFALLGWIGLLVPQYRRRREEGGVLLAWAAFAYLFWTVVPNRQFRFLAPGLPPLAVALASAWPKSVTWGVAALQIFTAVNFTTGWIGPVDLPLPGQDLRFFANQPPKTEDWKVEEILRLIEASRDRERPMTNVTLVANDHHFNAPTFSWSRRRLGLDHLRMRGVTRRLSELSEFVIVKDGHLGPKGVVDGLPEAAAEIKREGGWFSTAYEPFKSWPLPDGSTAALYRQRRGMKRPFSAPTLRYEFLAVGRAELAGLRVDFGGWDAARSLYRDARLRARRVSARGLVIRELDLEADEAALVPVNNGPRPEDWTDVRLLRLARLRLRGLEITAADLKAFLEERVKGLEVASLTLDGTVKASGKLRGRPVHLEAAIDVLDAPRRLRIEVRSARWSGIPLPTALFRAVKELTVPLEANPDAPFLVELPGVTVKDGKLTVP